jgi:hypothetical protein
MPISPKEIADKRIESTVNKLCGLIDKKIVESEAFPFEFHFLPNTDPQVITMIAEMYHQVGWRARLETSQTKDSTTKLILSGETFDDAVGLHVSTLKAINADGSDMYTDELQQKMSTVEGRMEIAMSMQETILSALLHQSVTRNFLMVDLLEGKPPLYEIDSSNLNAIYCNRKKQIAPYSEVDEFTPFVEIASCMNIGPPFTMQKLEKAQIRMKDSIERQEQNILSMLLQAAVTEKRTIHTYPQTIEIALLDAISEIESYDNVPAARMLVHPVVFHKLFMNNSMKEFENSTNRDKLLTGLYGRFREVDVRVAECIPRNEIFITPPQHFLGALSVQEDVTVVPSQSKNEKDEDQFEFITYTKVLPSILNPEFVRKVKIRF